MFPEIRFRGSLRPSQSEVAQIALRELESGQRRLHIVAPPGSGKTVVGLYLWAQRVRRPALVLSPNSAIQAQWAARTSLFERADGSDLAASVSTSPRAPGLLTSLTYQAVTLPAAATDALDQQALGLWMQNLLEKDQAESLTAAEIWIDDLRRHNPGYYDERLAHYRKRARDADASSAPILQQLHVSARDALERLRDADVGLLILDECHHLMGHWGRVLAEVEDLLDDPVIVGLTATPPDRGGRRQDDIERYDRFFGEIDFEVPLPAVVKDGFLAPYQDLAWFVRPTQEELRFIAQVDEQMEAVVDELCDDQQFGTPPGAIDLAEPGELSASGELSVPGEPAVPGELSVPGEVSSEPAVRESLPRWLTRVLRDQELVGKRIPRWRDFHRRDPAFVEAAVRCLRSREVPLPENVPDLVLSDDEEELPLVTVIDRYVRHHLRRSPHAEDHALAERATDRLRMLGVQITDTGHRPCASPVGRVMAYTRNKTAALIPILRRESELLGDRIRAVIIADYEKTSAISAEVSHLLDDEAGGAVAAFRELLRDEVTDGLDPVLLTGSTVLVDEDLADALIQDATAWLAERSMQVELSHDPEDGFSVIVGRGADWCPRVYVQMITDLFQQGRTRCLVGTRGLLGEGWDANTINVLIDLSSVTTSMTVNQLRGRSIRLNPDEPGKLANNWDLVCIAPEFTKGLADYHRFIRKHRTLFGICDDGAIEKGVGHVHAAFTELEPELLDGSVEALNADMLHRAGLREQVREQWQIGQAYSGQPIRAVEIRGGTADGGFPPFRDRRDPWSPHSLALAIGEALLGALWEAQLLQGAWPVHVGERNGGFVRVFLENAEEADAALFAAAFREAAGPLDNPRYVIPRSVDRPVESLLTRLLPSVIARFFRKRKRSVVMLHAVPTPLARRRELVDIFQRHWNRLVSPGEAVYTRQEDGERLLQEAARNGHLPDATVHDKEIFL